MYQINTIDMNTTNGTLDTIKGNELDLFLERGNSAGKNGQLNESMSWYQKGLSKAKELHDNKKMSEFSALIFMLL